MASVQPKRGYLFVLPWDLGGVGGVNEVVFNLYDQLEKSEEYYPIIMINKWSCIFPTMSIVDGRVIIRQRLYSPVIVESAKNFRKYVSFFARCFNLLVILYVLIRHRICMVNPHYPTLPTCSFYKLRKLLIDWKFVLSFHGSDVVDIVSGGPDKMSVWDGIFAKSDKFVTCSCALKHELLSALRLKEKDIVMIYNGVASNFCSNPSTLDSFPETLKKSKYILSVGTYEYKKGQDVLLAAFSRVVNNFDSKYLLIFVGRHTEYLKCLKKMTVDLNIVDKVYFFCDVPRISISKFYEHADFFVLSSRKEPFGIVLLEAGLCGLPVIASDVGGIREIIQNNVTGRLVPVGDEEQMAKCLEQYMKYNIEVQRYGIRLQKEVRFKFTWQKALNDYIKLCEE